jgi:hypothetical protein
MGVLLACLVWSTAGYAAAQIVQGQIDGVGFETSAGPVLRAGQWCPVRVSLQSQGSQLIAGELRLEALDLDGDRVTFHQPPITLAGEAGPPKRVWCYLAVNAVNELPAAVQFADTESQALLAELPLPPVPPIPLHGDDVLVLDLSYSAVSSLNSLITPGWQPGQPTEGARRTYRNYAIAHAAPVDLPDRWWGLEAVDVIVWDQPDPAVLSIPQRDALTEWVRQGGQLVVGIGAAWPALHKSELAEILPLAGDGQTISVERFDTLFARLGHAEWKSRVFRDPVPVTLAQPAPGAFRTFGEFGPRNEPLCLVTMRLVGAGRVVATAAGLRDLTSVPLNAEQFWALLLDVNTYSAGYVKNQQSLLTQFSPSGAVWLYEDLVKPVSFGAASALRGVTVLLFVVAYVLAATLVSWWYLRRRGWTQWSWPVFAGFAVAGGGVSLGTVSAMRGLIGGVQSLCVLDVEPGTTKVHGRCWFGYRSPLRQRVELTLPGDGNFLRPLARHPRVPNYYMTSARYAATPTRATLSDVLVRGTLKQVEGHWRGDLDGLLRGDLTADRRSGRLLPTSWLANDTSVALAGGYLLYIDPRQDDGTGVPWRAAGLTLPYALPETAGGPVDREIPPAANILVVRLPALASGQQIRGLGAADYERIDAEWVAWARRPTRKRSEMYQGQRDLRTLWAEQQTWADNGVFAALRRTLPDGLSAVLLSSTRNFHLPNRTDDFDSAIAGPRGDGVPSLDISHWLVHGQAVFIAWAESAGPPQLHRNGRPLDSLAGLTVYRVRLPLTYEGAPPRGDVEP